MQHLLGFAPEYACNTHVALSGGGPWAVEAVFPAVRQIDLRNQDLDRIIAFMRPNVPGFDSKAGAKIFSLATTETGALYGWWSLFWFELRLLIPWIGPHNIILSHNAPYCSCLVAWAYKSCGWDLFPGQDYGSITPAHFASCALLDFFIPHLSRGASHHSRKHFSRPHYL